MTFVCFYNTGWLQNTFYHPRNPQTATAARRVLRDGDEPQGAADERTAAAK